MPTYITLVRFTQTGIERINEGPARLDDAKQIFESMGAKIKEFYLVMGRYDMVIVVEAPDDETVTKLALRIGARGTSRTETFRAFTEVQYREIVSGLP